MKTRIAVVAGLAFLLFGISTSAQAPVYHEGETIRVSVTFEGPDASKITTAFIVLRSSDPIPANQAGFQTQCQSLVTPVSGSKVELTCKILDNQASGEYKLVQITAVLDQSAPVRFDYTSPSDFPPKTFKIENSKTVVKPSIKDVKELPKS